MDKRKVCTLERIQSAIVEGYLDDGKDMTREDIANAIGCSTGTVSRILRQSNGDVPGCRQTDVQRAPSFRWVDGWRPEPWTLAELVRDHVAVLDKLSKDNDRLGINLNGLSREQYRIWTQATIRWMSKEDN